MRVPRARLTTTLILALLTAALAGCKPEPERQDARPLVLRDVPAQRLAYRLEPDSEKPPGIGDDTNDRLATIQTDFTTRRTEDALIRTVLSPDGQRALALYGSGNEPSSTFHIDLYAADGKFLRNVSPPDLSCLFPETAQWSPDGNSITFIARKPVEPSPTPTPPPEMAPPPGASPLATPSIAPAFPSLPAFNTEQIYIGNRDGYDLRPLTSREGLIYFHLAWAPDSQALVALACKEAEWDAREAQFKLPVGRPRLISLDGEERLLDDRLTEALPVWSPDSAKVATGFSGERDMDVTIYDAATKKPTQGRIPLGPDLIAASIVYEQKTTRRMNDTEGARATPGLPVNEPGVAQPVASAAESPDSNSAAPAQEPPPSFNPIVRLRWVSPEKLYFQTAFVQLLRNETITFQRWHLLTLSPMAAMLK